MVRSSPASVAASSPATRLASSRGTGFLPDPQREIVVAVDDHGPSDGRFKADDGARTHDLDLGKVALYQLSYIRRDAA